MFVRLNTQGAGTEYYIWYGTRVLNTIYMVRDRGTEYYLWYGTRVLNIIYGTGHEY